MQGDSGRVGAPRLVLGLLFGLSFLSNAYFLQSLDNPNAISRAALSVALIEHGTPSIDALADLAKDKAIMSGHYYSDKAPGMSFLAVPAAAAFIAIVNPRHDDQLWHGGSTISATFGELVALSAVVTSSLLTAISVALMCAIVVRLTGSLRCAVLIAFIYGQATPIWFWATTFFGHSVAAALLVLGFHALLKTTGEGKKRWALWSGLTLGWAVLVELTAAVPVAMLVVFALWHLRTRRQLARCSSLIALGGFPALGLLLAYNAAAFGSPFELGYSHVDGYDGMLAGFYGITMPRLSILWKITFGDQHGLLCLSPVLALLPLGIASAALSPRWRALGALWTLIVVYYFLLDSGFVIWDGGDSTGPRHVTASLPFACLLLAPLWEAGGQVARRAIVALGAASGVLCLIAVSVSVTMPNDWGLSIAGFLLPRFWDGSFDGGVASVLRQRGWPGVSPVLPYVLASTLIMAALTRIVGRGAPASTSRP